MIIKDDFIEWDGDASNWHRLVNGWAKEIETVKIDDFKETMGKKKKRDRLIAGEGCGVKWMF